MDIETIEKLLGKPDAYVIDVNGWKDEVAKPSVVEAIREAFADKSCICGAKLVGLRKKDVYGILGEDIEDFVELVEEKLTENDGFASSEDNYNLEKLILNAVECSFNEKNGSSVYEKSAHIDLQSKVIYELWEMGSHGKA